MRKFLAGLMTAGAFIMIYPGGVASGAVPQVWDFDTPAAPGVAPAGWQDASQSMSPAPSPPGPYQTTTFGGESVILFQTEAGTQHRPKVRTQQTFTTGIYEWDVYIPEMEDNARVSLGAFLYSDQSGGSATAAREIDFEIGPGRASVRSSIPGLPEDALVVYLTVQPDNDTGRSGDPGSSLFFQPANPDHHVYPEEWYTLSLELREDSEGRYVVDWYIQGQGGPRIKARPTYTTAYGPDNDHPTNFRIYNSLENLNFMGDALPTRDHVVYFSQTRYTPVSSPCLDGPSGPQVLTDIEGDFSNDAVPMGSPGEWTRFGGAAPSVSITTDPALVDEGDASLATTGDFAVGSWYGVRYNIPGPPIDLECASAITWRMRTDAPGDQTVRFVITDEDGDIWAGTDQFSPTGDWETYEIDFEESAFILAEHNGNGEFDGQIAALGFDFFANGTTSSTPTFFIDNILWHPAGSPLASLPELPLVTGMEPPDFTIGAFPPDIESPGFPGSAERGEWTRFGAAYTGIQIVEDPASAPEGGRFLQVSANWAAGSRVGVRTIPHEPVANWAGYNRVHFNARSIGSVSGTSIELALFESDGDIWTAQAGTLSSSWEEYEVRIPEDFTPESSAGGGTLLDTPLILLGWNVDNPGGAGAESIQFDNLRLENADARVADWMVVY